MTKLPEARDLIWDEVIKVTWVTIDHHKGALDSEFGQGFCKEHPEVLLSVVQATMTAWGNALIAAAIQDSRK